VAEFFARKKKENKQPAAAKSAPIAKAVSKQ